MEEDKKLYPLILTPVSESENEIYNIVDLGCIDTPVRNGWLEDNSLSEIMDTYMDRVVGENVFSYCGRQFPIMVKTLTIDGSTALMVHPDDEIAAERYDFLGKGKLWYIAEAQEGAEVVLGFKKKVEAPDFYMACRHGEVEEMLHTVKVKKGYSFFIKPGVVNAARGKMTIVEIAECSPLDFNIYNWGAASNPEEVMEEFGLEEAFDFIDYGAFDMESAIPDLHHHHHHSDNETSTRVLNDFEQYTVRELKLKDSLHIYSGKADSFFTYTCISGEACLTVEDENTGKKENYALKTDKSILVPAEVNDFYLTPLKAGTVVLEAMAEKRQEKDSFLS